MKKVTANGFDNALYVKKQAENIKKRIEQFDNKLYLEFGGKLFDDYHASRVLPGFDPSVKVKLLTEFKDDAEIIFCINAGDIEKKKIRADFGITYDLDLLRASGGAEPGVWTDFKKNRLDQRRGSEAVKHLDKKAAFR